MNTTNHIKLILTTVIAFLIATNLFSQTKWRFAVVGDTHIGLTDTIAEIIPFIISDSVDLVLIPGDIVQAGRRCSADRLKNQLIKWQNIFAPFYNKGIGVYPLRGNHEDDANQNKTVWNNVFSGKYLLPQNGPLGETNLTYSFSHKNAFFIGLDNYINIHTVNQNWLDQQLKSNTLPHVFVFGHEPAFKVFHSDCLDDSVSARNTFWKSLTQSNARVYFCGHDHFSDVALVNDLDGNNNNNIYQYVVGSGGGPLKSRYNYNGSNTPYELTNMFHEMELGYALIEITENKLTNYTIRIIWKHRVWNSEKAVNEYRSTSNIITYTK
jgi:hypothetical protein